MSEVTFKGHRFTVVDDFLPEDEFRQAQTWARSRQFQMKQSVIGERDGSSWRSSNIAFSGEGAHDDATPAHLERIVEMFSQPHVPWEATNGDRVSSAIWKYPRGTRLGWHNDAGGGRVGEFVYFLHSEWQPDWGGELVVVDEPAENVSLTESASRQSIRHFVASGPGIATLVTPRPNRVIFVKSGTAHTIKRVEAEWSGEMRLTHTGFITSLEEINRQRARRLVETFT
ncbi:2OG-Fe(II) oxygenase [Janibacter anophelis]|uniref:2OG-Fe(II) oxygenase n=1 Tax=Janibacter anophelis TaxID=319054 RepID=UPI003F817988